MRGRWLSWISVPVVATATMLSACGNERSTPSAGPEKRGAAPPGATTAPSSAGPTECATGKLADAVADKAFPRRVDSYCLTFNETAILYGEGGKPLKGICDPFDGECDVYFAHGIDRLAQVTYAALPGGSGAIDANLSRFATPEGAYAMFTKRTVGDSDPADADAARPLDAGGAAALGVGNAYLWRGRYLVELTFVDTKATEQQTRAAADKLLPGLAKSIGDSLDGDKALPAAVALLPSEERLPLGVRFVLDDALGAKGAGAAAFGFHRTADGKRYRSLALTRPDEASARAAFTALTEGGKSEPGIGDAAASATRLDGKLQVAWVLARKGAHVFGVGDESRVLRVGMSAGEIEKISLSAADKEERLKKAVR